MFVNRLMFTLNLRNFCPALTAARVNLRQNPVNDYYTRTGSITLLIAMIITAGIYLAAQGNYGLGACAFVVAAISLWWDGQPGHSHDQDS